MGERREKWVRESREVGKRGESERGGLARRERWVLEERERGGSERGERERCVREARVREVVREVGERGG